MTYPTEQQINEAIDSIMLDYIPEFRTRGLEAICRRGMLWMQEQIKPEVHRIISEDDKSNDYFATECETCGWMGSSGDCNGGGQIGDTGDYSDPTCPVCSNMISCDEIEEDQPLICWVVARNKANEFIKELIEKLDLEMDTKVSIESLMKKAEMSDPGRTIILSITKLKP